VFAHTHAEIIATIDADTDALVGAYQHVDRCTRGAPERPTRATLPDYRTEIVIDIDGPPRSFGGSIKASMNTVGLAAEPSTRKPRAMALSSALVFPERSVRVQPARQAFLAASSWSSLALTSSGSTNCP